MTYKQQIQSDWTKPKLDRYYTNKRLACSARVFFERAICSRLLFLLSPIFHCHKIKDGGYNNITNTNKVSPTQNTPALQANKRRIPTHPNPRVEPVFTVNNIKS